MEEKTFGIRMRARADAATERLLAPRCKQAVDNRTIDDLLVRIKKKIEQVADKPAYYCPFVLYGRREGEIGFFKSQEEAVTAGHLLARKLEAEGIETVVREWIGAVTLELAWREERSLADDFET